MTITDSRIPVHILTGFLGSGKTTLLREYLQQDEANQTALIINEVGDIGIDHHLAQHLEGDTVLLESGCLCCQVRDDLKRTLFTLLNNKTTETIRQVIIETTGLANPSPILSTLFNDNDLSSKVRKGKIIATVDALEAIQNTQHIPEWSNQISSADALIITKAEKQSEQALTSLKEQYRAINPFAEQFVKCTSQGILAKAIHSPLNPRGFLSILTNNTNTLTLRQNSHSHIQTQAISVSGINWQRFSIWLSMLLYRYNDQILRVKGLLLDQQTGNYLLLNAVRQTLAPLEMLGKEALSKESRGPVKLGLVFITRNIDPEEIVRSFNTFKIALN